MPLLHGTPGHHVECQGCRAAEGGREGERVGERLVCVGRVGRATVRAAVLEVREVQCV